LAGFSNHQKLKGWLTLSKRTLKWHIYVASKGPHVFLVVSHSTPYHLNDTFEVNISFLVVN